MTRELAYKTVNMILKWHDVPEIQDTRPGEQTWREFSASWLQDIQSVNGMSATFKQYRSHVKLFTEFLKKDLPLQQIERKDCQGFYNWILEERASKTCQNIMTTLRMIFNQAVSDELLTKNPASKVKQAVVKERQKEPFTLEDIAKIRSAIEDIPNGDEWLVVFLLGICTGARLDDCTIRKWSEINLDGDMPHMVYVPGKTERYETVVKVPLVNPLWSHLRSLGPQLGEFITPALASVPVNGSGGLSFQFMNLLRDAGVEFRTEKPKGKAGKAWNSKGFHSTRHTLPSLMAAQDVPEEVRMAIVGHTQKDTHHRYTHHDDQRMRGALEKSLRVLA